MIAVSVRCGLVITLLIQRRHEDRTSLSKGRLGEWLRNDTLLVE